VNGSRGQAHQRRRDVVAHVQQEVGAERLALLLEIGGLRGDLAKARGRAAAPTGSDTKIADTCLPSEPR
jgi:hypothetical protein